MGGPEPETSARPPTAPARDRGAASPHADHADRADTASAHDDSETLFRLLFSPGGRISRRTWWVYGGLLDALTVALTLILARQPTALWSVVLLLACWPRCAAMVKRCHDVGYSGRFALWTLVPGWGWGWFLARVSLRRGAPGPNRYGADPSGREAHNFRLGAPILVMLLVSGLCAVGIATRPDRGRRADLVAWIFAESHHRTYTRPGPEGEPSLIESFERQTGLRTEVDLVSERAQGVRLVSIFMSGMTGPAVPDVCEVEINSVGKFFRPPVQDVGFLPLNHYLRTRGEREIESTEDWGHSGWRARLRHDGAIYVNTGGHWIPDPDATKPDTWIDRIIYNRFAPWSKEDVIFGVPHDVHPVAICYRHDLFTQTGIDLLAESDDPRRPLTWARFQELCLRFKRYWAARGVRERHPIELRTSGVEDLLVLLLQRRLNLVDQYNHVHFRDPRIAQTVAFYAQLVAGPRRIGGQSGIGEAATAQDLNAGSLCGFITPDWRIRYIRDWTAVDPATGRKKLAGAMRVIPLPVFEKGDARTGTSGGTMIGIPRACPRPDEAWKLIEHLYLSDEGFEARMRETNILPPVISQWDDPRYDRPDPFFGGQKVDRLYVELAHEIPQRYVTPVSTAANAALSDVLFRAIRHVEALGTDGLDEACAAWLAAAADDLEARIRWGKFE